MTTALEAGEKKMQVLKSPKTPADMVQFFSLKYWHIYYYYVLCLYFFMNKIYVRLNIDARKSLNPCSLYWIVGMVLAHWLTDVASSKVKEVKPEADSYCLFLFVIFGLMLITLRRQVCHFICTFMDKFLLWARLWGLLCHTCSPLG